MNIYRKLFKAVERSKTYVRTTNEDGEHCEFDAINADKLLAELKKLEKESGPKSSCCGAPLKLDDDGNGWTGCSHCDEPPVSLPPLTQEKINHYKKLKLKKDKPWWWNELDVCIDNTGEFDEKKVALLFAEARKKALEEVKKSLEEIVEQVENDMYYDTKRGKR